MEKPTKRAEALRIAHHKGYRVVQGQVISPHGVVRKCQVHSKIDRTQYLRFNVGTGKGKRFPISVHQLVAFQKFGEAMFEPGIQVRHKDNNSLNNFDDNILLGTQSENALDRSPEDRRQHSRKAWQKRGLGFSQDLIEQIRRDHMENGIGYKKLHAKYGMAMSTLSYYLSRTAKKISTSYPFADLHDAANPGDCTPATWTPNRGVPAIDRASV